MSYFTEISDYRTYEGEQGDFHFSYNANSGGGQSFLGGQYVTENGSLESSSMLDGKTCIFCYFYKNEEGRDFSILLNDDKGRYEIKPRGEGSNSMKFGVGNTKITPSKLISSFFMLPLTCTVKSPTNLNISILTSNNFWLQSMFLKCKTNTNSTNEILLYPQDFIYCGGINKESQGSSRYFKLEALKRIKDIIFISKQLEHCQSAISQHVKVFADIYLGITPFNYEKCVESTRQLMRFLSDAYPDKYYGIEDPLPILLSLISEFKSRSTSLNTTSDTNTLYRPYITAIKSKPFLLLAGISGTGKSRIVRELARACWDVDSEEYKAQKPKNFEMVQVKPNWHDSSELIGYVSRINGTPEYIVGDFLKFIAKAWENWLSDEKKPYFLCLDEMNLAPVEQYFAEYLSVIESRKIKDGGIVTDPIVKNDIEGFNSLLKKIAWEKQEINDMFEADGICIPPNLIVVGTVNMDETTFSFSRKVLDRAMTIEMNKADLSGGLTSRHEQIGKLGNAKLVGTAVEGVDVYSDYRDVCDKCIAYLKNVNEVLEGTPFKIAYRTRNEALLYVVNNLPYTKEKDGTERSQEYVIARALDEITNMKILSRIEGDESKVSKDFLTKLRDTIKTNLDGIAELDEHKSLDKIKEMQDKLDSGYTSFWS